MADRETDAELLARMLRQTTREIAQEHRDGGHKPGERWFSCPLCDDEGEE